MDRRGFIKGLVATTGLLAFGHDFWRRALASHIVPGDGPYGALGPANPFHGIRLPAGFSIREVARSRDRVEGTAYTWHNKPDGGATFATPDGGWIYVSNSEINAGAAGVGAVRFDSGGQVVDAYRILDRTANNCAGGSTPWGTWLSCEEVNNGLVWECDPLGQRPAIPRRALGTFEHEAAVVDPATNYVYLTEDDSEGRFYRFRPSGDPVSALRILELGTLEVAKWNADGSVDWLTVPDPNPINVASTQITTPTRRQVPESTAFKRGEGAWFDDGVVYFCTTTDERIWAYHTDTETLEVLFDSENTPGSPLSGADNITVSPSGDLYICEDHGPSEGPVQLVIVDRVSNEVAVFLEASGPQHAGSELTGVAFDPSGTRMYISSQRAYLDGATYEITGPFRLSA